MRATRVGHVGAANEHAPCDAAPARAHRRCSARHGRSLAHRQQRRQRGELDGRTVLLDGRTELLDGCMVR
jgi:hypothetical protein